MGTNDIEHLGTVEVNLGRPKGSLFQINEVLGGAEGKAVRQILEEERK